VKVELQLEVVALTVVKLQGDPVKLPRALPPFVKATVPVGVLAVPAVEVSLTKAVQVVAWLTKIVEGEHVTVVDVVLRLTVTAGLDPLLPLCAVSVAATVNVALATTVPDDVGAIEAEQLDVVALRVVKLHGVPVKVPAAVPVLLNATVPAGALAVPATEVSFTKAVQLVDCATTMVVGEQVTTVDVVLRLTVTVLLDTGPLPECTPSVEV